MSSIMINDECIEYFRKFNHRKGDNFAVYKFDGESIIIEDANHSDLQRTMTWDELKNSKFPDDECRYCFYKFNYFSPSDEIERSKLIYILWSPSGANKKQKMMSAFFNQAFLDRLGATSAISCQIQAGNLASLEKEDVQEKLFRKLSVK